ncbi:soluble nsf attachment protein SNAP, putative [Theileria equi strain WA]|uniref:Soluble nsf attachment protein SNAP, putative n=1 Tax=Theileria equi strain WA TaxID=1537102 RepID=L0AYG2_THEEQ|nr:soluble nsf attachment protein SNAP, putative [Theileria equi strain WA]AFZ80632.1 soluble nsf attachment protein SNAP, putative [Theileria equi strain WA]|eukprot:XP_004830298.1 soluble nsf attachment protein SNAP, putative [Theileria equi strain WA]
MSTPQELEKKARSSAKSLFSFIFGSNSDEAQDLYNQAGNQYKQLHQWKDAARCFQEAANIGEKNKDMLFAASNLVEASNALLKFDSNSLDHVDPLIRATTIYNTQGRFAQSGRILKKAAEHFEENSDPENAIKFYKKAAESFELDEYGKTSGSQCLLKFADLSSLHPDLPSLKSNAYIDAIKIYEEEGKKNTRNSLLQYGVRDLFLKAGLLHILAVDITDARIAHKKYINTDPKFENSREDKFLNGLIEAYEALDVAEFTKILRDYDGISKLDPWKISILSKV